MAVVCHEKMCFGNGHGRSPVCAVLNEKCIDPKTHECKFKKMNQSWTDGKYYPFNPLACEPKTYKKELLYLYTYMFDVDAEPVEVQLMVSDYRIYLFCTMDTFQYTIFQVTDPSMSGHINVNEWLKKKELYTTNFVKIPLTDSDAVVFSIPAFDTIGGYKLKVSLVRKG